MIFQLLSLIWDDTWRYQFLRRQEQTELKKLGTCIEGVFSFFLYLDCGDVYTWGKGKHGCLGLFHSQEQCFPLKVSITQSEEQCFPLKVSISQSGEQCFPLTVSITQSEEQCFPLKVSITQSEEQCFPLG